jgi:hypothetical protein
MVRQDDDKVQFLAAQIELLRGCTDSGQRRRGEWPVVSHGQCDLCTARPDVGRLLIGETALELMMHRDGRVDVETWRPDNPMHAMYWICLPCKRLLDANPPALLLRLLEAHGQSRN